MPNTIQAETNTQEVVEKFHESLDEHYPEIAKDLKDFVTWNKENRGFDEQLTIAVIEQFDAEGFTTYADDVTNHGIMGGYSGFTWYDDTVAFYTTNKDQIIKWAKDLNDSLGEGDSYLAMIASFNIMKDYDFGVDKVGEFIYSGNTELDGFTQFANNMTWGVAEDVCRHYVDFMYEKGEEENDEDE